MSTALSVAQTNTLDATIIDKLETWEDHVSFYLQLEEGSSAFAWLKADTLAHLLTKFGDSSIEKFANEINQKRSTVVNYLRTAKAFSSEQRIPSVSFSAHFQSSFADSYDTTKGEFVSNNRFKWIEKAADEGLSTRRLAEGIKVEKRTAAGEDPDNAFREVDTSTKIDAIKQHLEILQFKIGLGNIDAYEDIKTIYGQIFKKRTS